MNKRFGAGLLLVGCVALLAACGSAGHASVNQVNTGQMRMSTSQATIGQSHTGATTPETNTSQASASTMKAMGVSITLSDFHIASSLMTFTAGVPYHFTVTNRGKSAHELMLMSTTMKTMPMDGMPMKNMDQMALADLEAMSPGTTKTFDYTFVFSTAGPHPEFSCHLPGHYQAGMHLDVAVNQ